jgi:hypothetical protein
MAGLDEKLRDKGLINVEANVGDQENDKPADLVTSPEPSSEPEDKPEPKIIRLYA